jgi:hypothetical protein
MSEYGLNGTTPDGRDGEALAALSTRVKDKRDAIDAYLAAVSKKRDRLLSMTIFGGSLAAALTAGPAFGGKPFSLWLEQDVGLDDPAWRLLCAAAMICSLAATIATQLQKSKGYDDNIARARNARGVFEALDVGIMCGHLSRGDATGQYLRCIEDLAFLDTGDARGSRNTHSDLLRN